MSTAQRRPVCRDDIKGKPQLSVADGSIGSPLAEDCSNGIDDNANCLIDCKDPGCKWIELAGQT